MTNAAPPFVSDVCSAREAIYALAGEPLEELVDPFADGKSLGQMASGGSRWLLANRAAARARAAHGEEGTPRPTQEWIALRERERFSTGPRATLFSDDAVFAKRLDAVDRYSREVGVSAGALAEQFDRLAPAAEVHLDRRDRRNARIQGAGQRLLRAARRAQGPQAYGRNQQTGSWEAIDRRLLFHPGAHWRREPSALLYENQTCLTGELVIGDVTYTEVTFAADDVLALRVEKQPAPARESPATKREAVKVLALDLFPNGLPLIANQRDREIIAEFKRRHGAYVCETTIRAAIRGLKAEGKLGS